MKRLVVEAGIVAGTKRELLPPEVIAEALKRILRSLKGRAEQPLDRRRLAKLEKELANLTDAIAAGALRASPAIAAKLQATEAELAKLDAVKPTPKVSPMPAGIEDSWRKAVTSLESVLATHDVARSRTTLRDLIGEV